MSDELLPYYDIELSFIRRLAGEFAENHPKIAERLRLGPDSSDDPHVERLIQAFAFLSARIRHKLDDDFPEISEALLGVLYPHYLAPIPSMAIVQFEMDPQQNELTSGHTIPRHTALETEPIQGNPCRFQTCYSTTLWPIDVESATLARPPVKAPTTKYSEDAQAILKLVLRCRSDKITFAALELNDLRFYFKGQPQHVHRLYELLFNNTLGIALASPEDPAPVVLGPEFLHAVGFDREEGMLPYPARSFVGYRLLTELFAFAAKFHFADLVGCKKHLPRRVGNRLEIYFYFNKAAPELESSVRADMFRLGCSPVVNLYRQPADPIGLTQDVYEYRVVPDARRPLAHEVYSVDRVVATTSASQRIEYQPFFSTRHTATTQGQTFWHASWRKGESGRQVFLNLVDLDWKPSNAGGHTLDVETTCLNGDLPHRLPFGGDQPRLQLSEGSSVVTRILCLTAPTRTLRPNLRAGTLWRLISHLSLNHLSLLEEGDQAHALREILLLYDFTGAAENRKMIEGISRIAGERVVGRVGPRKTLCRGVEVRIQFNEENFTGTGLFLFASVLEHFLGLYCSLNSFTRMVATIRGGERELRRWPPRTGEKVLI